MIWLEANTERSESNPGRSLGIIDMKRMAVWKTVPPTERSIRVNPINPCSKKKLAVVKRTRMKRIDADEIKYQYIKIVLLSGCLVV